MKFQSHIPAPPLAEFVEMVWSYEQYAPGHAAERLLPTGTTELVVDLRDEMPGGPVVCGPHSTYFALDTARQASVIGIHFKPGGAAPFLGVPADELHNRQVSLDALWGARAHDLRERLLDAGTCAGRFRILEQALLARATRGLARHPAVALAMRRFADAPHASTIADVTHQAGLSPRRFIEVFAREVGMTPKLFCRVRRFQRTLRLIQARQQVQWADLALSCGFYNQAHLISEFRTFSGLNPTAYLRVRGEHLNHVPLPG